MLTASEITRLLDVANAGVQRGERARAEGHALPCVVEVLLAGDVHERFDLGNDGLPVLIDPGIDFLHALSVSHDDPFCQKRDITLTGYPSYAECTKFHS